MGSSSSYKSNMNNSSNNNSNRAKPYAVMLLLAFGAAILGVMVLHKLRENRIYTLLVKEKDHQLLTLHLLFQREQEFNKDARKKIEEMKTKVYSLRSQKLELDRRLLEMESTIAALRDERKVIESSLEEKKNEIKMLTEGGMNSTFSQVSALQDMIKMKELEIEHLKLRLSKVEPNSTGVSMKLESENESQLQVNNSFAEETKSENGNQIDDVILQTRQHSTNETKKFDEIDEDEPRVRQEEKWVDERVVNGVVLNNKDENQKENKAGFQSARVMDVTAAKVNDTRSSQDNSRKQESRDLTRALRGVNGLGVRVRRHSRGSRLRAVEAGALSNLKEDIDPNYSRKEVGPLEVHQAKSEKEDQTRDTDSNDRGSTEKKQKGIEEAENVDKDSSISREGNKNENGSSTANVTKIDDGINNGLDIDANRKLLKMHNINVNKYKGEDEEVKGIEVDEGEGDDTDEIREPGIDRADIKRFAESDLDEEEAEEAAEETEF